MLDDDYNQKLQELRKDGLYRQLRQVEGPVGPTAVFDGQEKLMFCSNNYLALAAHPAVIQAATDGLAKWGCGAGGSRLICGNTAVHEQLQERIAKMLGKQAALLFPSGFTTNTTVLNTLADEDDLILIDKLDHASIIDGGRQAKCEVRSSGHLQYDKLKKLLDRGGFRRAFIVTDSLFSMDGDFADLAKLVEIKIKYNATLMIDEAHAFGCIGPGGKGVAAEAGVLDDIDIVTGTLSKALGSAGGFVATTNTVCDYLINKARGFIYTTALPNVACLAAEAALDVIESEPQRRRRLIDNGEYFRRRCRELNLDIGNSTSYIVPVILGDASRTLDGAGKLWEQGFSAPAIRPPTVKPGSSRLRISLMSEHTKEDIDNLLNALIDIL